MKEEGGVALYTGLAGMLALMQDSIKRWFTQGQDPDELLDLAAKSLLCLQLAIQDDDVEGVPEEPSVLLESVDEDIVDLPEDLYDYKEDETDPGPLPENYSGWQFDQGIATRLHRWLVKTERWDLLGVEQQEGILRAVNGDLDNPDTVLRAEHEEPVESEER